MIDLTIEDILKSTVEMFNNIDKEVNELSRDLSVVDTKQQEILHFLENHDMNASGYAKLGKLLKKLRRERRNVKNNLDRLRSIQSSLTNNKTMQNTFKQALSNLNKVESKQNNPCYTYQYLTPELEMKEVI